MLLGCDVCPVTAIMSLQNSKSRLKQNNKNNHRKYIKISYELRDLELTRRIKLCSSDRNHKLKLIIPSTARVAHA